MHRQAALGRSLLALALLLFAAQHIFYATGSSLPPIGPPWLTGNPLWAWLTAGLLALTAASLVTGRRIALVTSIAGSVILLYGIACYLPALVDKITAPGPWTSGAELVSLGGALVACSGSSRDPERSTALSAETVFRVGTLLYAVPLLVFAAQHFIYAQFVATLVPAWIPFHLFWAFAVGAGFVAAAASLIFDRMAWWGATLLGVQFLLWVVILHLPRALAATPSGNEWTSLGVALAMGGSAWLIAAGSRPATG
jgi:hypothetical protein